LSFITMKTISFILTLILFVGAKKGENNMLDDPEHKLICIESNYKDSAKSKRNAYGRRQITRVVLDDFNTFNKWGIKLTWREVKTIPSINDLVGHWQYKRLEKQWNYSMPHVINSYNMGSRNTGRGKFYDPYCYKILGMEYHTWRTNYYCYKREGQIFYLRRRKK
jgi:hypothetical protein